MHGRRLFLHNSLRGYTVVRPYETQVLMQEVCDTQVQQANVAYVLLQFALVQLWCNLIGHNYPCQWLLSTQSFKISFTLNSAFSSVDICTKVAIQMALIVVLAA